MSFIDIFMKGRNVLQDRFFFNEKHHYLVTMPQSFEIYVALLLLLLRIFFLL